jgi:hypothetical protein
MSYKNDSEILISMLADSSLVSLDELLEIAKRRHHEEFPENHSEDFACYVLTWMERTSGDIGSKDRARVERSLDRLVEKWLKGNRTFTTRGKPWRSSSHG